MREHTQKNWDVLHELMECGHPRACYQDRNYPASEQNYNPETFSGDAPSDYRCVMCEREKKLDDEIKRLGRVQGYLTEELGRKKGDIAKIAADNAALRADLESLNALLRELGYGQGEIDADMPELFRRIIVERGLQRDELERLREQLRPYKCGCPVVFDGFCEKHCMPRPESGEGSGT